MNEESDVMKAPKTPIEGFDPIDAALRQIFDKLSEEEVPEDFDALIAQFAERHEKRGEK